MHLNDLLQKNGIAPTDVLVLRHCPQEPKLRKKLPWLAAAKPELFNAYQQSQDAKVEKALNRAKYVASFIGVDAGKALFAGLFDVKGSRTISSEDYWQIPANKELRDDFGMIGSSSKRPQTLWFDLVLNKEFYPTWSGRLIIRWPGKELSWWRWADRNTFDVDAIRESTAFEEIMPAWDELVLTWPELKSLPSKWKDRLREWRGIYYIQDISDGRGYVGAAYNKENLLGRWIEYSKSGHGGDKKLLNRDPRNFRFSILQRVSPDMLSEEAIRLEATWKIRLHTRGEFGLNEN